MPTAPTRDIVNALRAQLGLEPTDKGFAQDIPPGFTFEEWQATVRAAVAIRAQDNTLSVEDIATQTFETLKTDFGINVEEKVTTGVSDAAAETRKAGTEALKASGAFGKPTASGALVDDLGSDDLGSTGNQAFIEAALSDTTDRYKVFTDDQGHIVIQDLLEKQTYTFSEGPDGEPVLFTDTSSGSGRNAALDAARGRLLGGQADQIELELDNLRRITNGEISVTQIAPGVYRDDFTGQTWDDRQLNENIRQFNIEDERASGEFAAVEKRLNQQLNLQAQAQAEKSEIALRGLGLDAAIAERTANQDFQEFQAEILRNPADFLARSFSLRGQTSPEPIVTQADLIGQAQKEFDAFRGRLEGLSAPLGAGRLGGFSPEAEAGAVAGAQQQSAPPLFGALADAQRLGADPKTLADFASLGPQPVPAFADGGQTGGSADGRLILVGEEGPELLSNPTNAPVEITPIEAAEHGGKFGAQEGQTRFSSREELMDQLGLTGNIDPNMLNIHQLIQMADSQLSTQDILKETTPAMLGSVMAQLGGLLGKEGLLTDAAGQASTPLGRLLTTTMQRDNSGLANFDRGLADASLLTFGAGAGSDLPGKLAATPGKLADANNAVNSGVDSIVNKVKGAPGRFRNQLRRSIPGAAAGGTFGSLQANNSPGNIFDFLSGNNAPGSIDIEGNRYSLGGPGLLRHESLAQTTPTHADGSTSSRPTSGGTTDIAGSRLQPDEQIVGSPALTQQDIINEARRLTPPGARAVLAGNQPAPLRPPAGLQLPTARLLQSLTKEEGEAFNTRLAAEFNITLSDLVEMVHRRFGSTGERQGRFL